MTAHDRVGQTRRAAGIHLARDSRPDRLSSYDTIASLSVAAGATSRIGLLSGVLLAPLYPPVWLAKAAASLDAMPEGEGTVLDNSCLLFLSNMWSGTKHDNKKVPVVTVGGLGGKLQTGRALDYFESGDDSRKLCSLYLSIMDRMGAQLAEFGDAKTRLAGF